jgi:hypothetical protein
MKWYLRPHFLVVQSFLVAAGMVAAAVLALNSFSLCLLATSWFVSSDQAIVPTTLGRLWADVSPAAVGAMLAVELIALGSLALVWRRLDRIPQPVPPSVPPTPAITKPRLVDSAGSRASRSVG